MTGVTGELHYISFESLDSSFMWLLSSWSFVLVLLQFDYEYKVFYSFFIKLTRMTCCLTDSWWANQWIPHSAYFALSCLEFKEISHKAMFRGQQPGCIRDPCSFIGYLLRNICWFASCSFVHCAIERMILRSISRVHSSHVLNQWLELSNWKPIIMSFSLINCDIFLRGPTRAS